MGSMNTRYRIAAAVALVAVGAGYVYVHATTPKTDAERNVAAGSASSALPTTSFDADVAATVTKIELTESQPREAIALEKKGGSWRVTSPVDVKASDSKVKELLENLRNLKIAEAVDKGIYAFDLYDLTDEAAFHVVARSGDRKVSDLYFGKSDTLKRFVRIAGIDGVFAVANSGSGGYSGFLYTRGLRSWRETSILEFSENDVASVEVTNKSGLFSFVRNGDHWSGSMTTRDARGKLRPPEDVWTKFDETKVKDLLRAFKSLSADDFGDEAQKTQSGVEQAEETGGVLRIRLNGGLGDRTLRVGKISTNTGRWAIAGSRWAILDGGDGTLYALAPWTAGWATANAHSFESADGGDDAGESEAGRPPVATTGPEHR
jgi:hypothetical protein